MIEAEQKKTIATRCYYYTECSALRVTPQHAFAPHFQPEFIINSYRRHGWFILSFSMPATKAALLALLLCVALV